LPRQRHGSATPVSVVSPPMSGVHQFVPMLHRGDAVGRHTRRLRELFVSRGIASRIYVEMIDPETAEETELALAYPAVAAPGDIVLYQFATASAMAPWLAARGETLVVNYHNITPPELVASWNNPLARGQLQAQSELRLLAPRAALAVADSAYNRGDLEVAGFATSVVVPPSAALAGDLLDAAQRAARPHGAAGRGARWLSVGRVAPNKAIDQTIDALAVTRAHHDPEATLLVVGKPAIAAYDDALRRYVAELGLADAVTFAGHASDATVAEAYAQADVLVVTSAHEGFCVPVTEAMTVGLPVVAYAQGALPEVLGEAGVLVDSVDPYRLAATIAGLLADPSRCAALRDAARRQLTTLDLEGAGARLVDLVCALR
jgi:glycosyltransferase involved in cell wall biosynthesis